MIGWDASRFARDWVAQELGVRVRQQRNVKVVTAGGDNVTETADPRQVMAW